MTRIFSLAISFLVLTAFFFLLERVFPNSRKQAHFRPGYFLDVLYWFFTPLISKVVSQAAIVVVAIPIVLALGLSVASFKSGSYVGFGPLSRQPVWLQGIEIFLLADLIGYWSHRIFHGKSLWSFHAVHHSSTELDWLSSVRLHPVNEAATRILEVIPVLCLGFNPKVLAAYVPLLTFYAIFNHCNLSWDYGPFRYLFTSPVFHRWHHSKEPEAIDKNFAGFLAFWELLFGTFYVPQDRLPTNFGINDPIVETLPGHLVHPFRKR